MHILYIHQYFCPPGGSGNTRSLDFALAWCAAGHRVTILTTQAYFPADLRTKGQTIRWRLRPGLEVHALDVPYSHMMPFRQRVASFLGFYRRGLAFAKDQLPMPDVIYASSTPPSVGEMGRKLARHWDIPYVFETVDVWPDVPEGMGIIRNRWLLRWLHGRVRRIYAEAHAVVALSEGMKAQVMRAGVADAKVHVVHNGTDPRQFPYVERPAKATVTCIYTGTVGKANGVQAVVQAAAAIAAQGRTDIRFVVLGGGNDLANVRALAEQLQPPNLAFKDPVPKEAVGALLAQADIGLVTFAPFEVLEANSANKWYDYLSTGLPVVTNYRGWQAAWMERHACGLSCPQGDLEAFCAAILRLADDAALRPEMGRRGRAMVEAHFDRGMLAERVLGLLKAAMA